MNFIKINKRVKVSENKNIFVDDVDLTNQIKDINKTYFGNKYNVINYDKIGSSVVAKTFKEALKYPNFLEKFEELSRKKLFDNYLSDSIKADNCKMDIHPNEIISVIFIYKFRRYIKYYEYIGLRQTKYCYFLLLKNLETNCYEEIENSSTTFICKSLSQDEIKNYVFYRKLMK